MNDQKERNVIMAGVSKVFFIKSQIVAILGFMGLVVSVAIMQFYHCSNRQP